MAKPVLHLEIGPSGWRAGKRLWTRDTGTRTKTEPPGPGWVAKAMLDHLPGLLRLGAIGKQIQPLNARNDY